MDTLIEWIPILVSAASLFISYYLYKETKSNNQKILAYDKQKELTRIQEKRLDDVISRLNSRSNFIPFFNIELYDKNIKFEERDKETHVVLTIKLRNIGKESASNIMLYEYQNVENSPNKYFKDNKDVENSPNKYFKDNKDVSDKYYIDDYLNKYYAFPKQCITFSLHRSVNKDKTYGDISFRIKFNDLIGNTYMQVFNFKYEVNVDGKCLFSRENYSNQPILLKSNLR